VNPTKEAFLKLVCMSLPSDLRAYTAQYNHWTGFSFCNMITNKDMASLPGVNL